MDLEVWTSRRNFQDPRTTEPVKSMAQKGWFILTEVLLLRESRPWRSIAPAQNFEERLLPFHYSFVEKIYDARVSWSWTARLKQTIINRQSTHPNQAWDGPAKASMVLQGLESGSDTAYRTVFDQRWRMTSPSNSAVSLARCTIRFKKTLVSLTGPNGRTKRSRRRGKNHKKRKLQPPIRPSRFLMSMT